MLTGKTVLLGVTGSIAAYKAVEVVRRLRDLGAEVTVIMTREATRLVAPLTFRTLSRQPVYVNLFAEPRQWEVEHIALAERAHLLLVAPATANIIGKMAHGIADDYLTTTVLATRAPVLVVPAMNSHMYTHPAVQNNLATLRRLGYRILEPVAGKLASEVVGIGRMPEPSAVVGEAVRILAGRQDLQGVKVLVTAGPTREPLDPVRFISNPSSGKMGYALAEEARDRGADVVLVSGPTALEPPAGVRVVRVDTAEEMREAVLREFPDTRVVIKAAAVSDYRPAAVAPEKIKKERETITVELVRNPDILQELGERKGDRILVGFAAETHDLLRHAREKMARKHLDLVVANDVTRPGAGFAVDTNLTRILAPDGSVEELPLLSKREVARYLWDRVVDLLKPGKQ